MARGKSVLGEEEARRAMAAAERWHGRSAFREAHAAAIRKKNYARADDPERLAKRMQRLGEWRAALAGRAPGGAADAAAESALPGGSGRPLRREDVTGEAAERVIGATRDILSVEFFEIGLDAARCVGRVMTGGAANGTGFLVGCDLVLTNHPVLPAKNFAEQSRLELDFEESLFGTAKRIEAFELLPERFFLADERLDFALVAVKPTSANGTPLAGYGFKPLISGEGKVAVAECVNLIQHPGDEPKRVVIRNNQLVDLFADEPGQPFFHYLADTEKGSSGSPVFNDQWELVALHHQSVPRTDAKGRLIDRRGAVIEAGDDRGRVEWIANEGIRVSHIVRFVAQATLAGPGQGKLRDDLLACWKTGSAPAAQLEAVAARHDRPAVRLAAEATDGTDSSSEARAANPRQRAGYPSVTEKVPGQNPTTEDSTTSSDRPNLKVDEFFKQLSSKTDPGPCPSTTPACRFYKDSESFCKHCNVLFAPDTKYLKDIVVGKKDQLENTIEKILWSENDLKVFVTKAGVFTHYSDCIKHSKEQSDRYEEISPLLMQLRFLVGSMNSGKEYYNTEFANSVVQALKGHIDQAKSSLISVIDLASDQVTNENRVKYFLACGTTALFVVASAVCTIWTFNSGFAPYGIAALAGAFGAAFSIAISFRRFELVPCRTSRMNYVVGALRVLIGATGAAVFLLAVRSGLVQDLAQAILGGTRAAGGELATEKVAMLGFLAGFAERLVPDMLSGAVDRMALHKQLVTAGPSNADQAQAAAPAPGPRATAGATSPGRPTDAALNSTPAFREHRRR